MKTALRRIETDLAIIGTGLAGIAASIFALNRDIPCALAGNTGALAYTTGYLDLFGHADGNFLDDPWQGINALAKTQDKHPLARLDSEKINLAFDEFTAFISDIGMGYTRPGKENLKTITPAGTIKPTLCVPQTMASGVEALRSSSPCKIIGFKGLKGFSALQVAANLKAVLPDIEAKIITFPGHEHGELYAEVAARSLEVESTRAELAEILRKEAGEATHIGLPAILGMHNPDEVLADLEKLTGLAIFEIPTMPPSVPGIRLRELVEQTFPARGMTLIPQQKVKNIDFAADNVVLQLSDNYGPIEITTKSAILATGRFLSGGLEAHFDHVSEALIDLPVTQPPSRKEWYQKQYLDQDGHDIHLAGIEVDHLFRPLNKDGSVFDKRLFGAGIVLAHQDWIRQRCGAGVAIATALAAVEAVEDLLKK